LSVEPDDHQDACEFDYWIICKSRILVPIYTPVTLAPDSPEGPFLSSIRDRTIHSVFSSDSAKINYLHTLIP
jgi:hypothetical protein